MPSAPSRRGGLSRDPADNVIPDLRPGRPPPWIGRVSRLGFERIANPLEFGVRWSSVNCHHVESARAIITDSSRHEEMLGRRDQPRPLARVDAFQSTSEPAIRTPSHLDEDKGVGIAHHEVDLAAPAPVVSRDERESPPGEKAFRKPFRVLSDRSRAIGPAMGSIVQRRHHR